ncbi:unnamed protein product, partial [Staurois parvus]
MRPPTDPGPSGSARVSKWSVRPCSEMKGSSADFCHLIIKLGTQGNTLSMHEIFSGTLVDTTLEKLAV